MEQTERYPTEIQHHKESRMIGVIFDDGLKVGFSCEFLRVNSPSAEVKGHGPGQETLVTGKRHVAIEHIEAVGNYAVALTFSDGHDSGIYSWDYLYYLAQNQQKLWEHYLRRLQEAGAKREV